MIVLEWLLPLGLGLLLVLRLVQSIRNDRAQVQLEAAFYRLLELDNCISLIQLATAARVDAETASEYLTAQVKVFAASLEVDADGDKFYRFPKLLRSPRFTINDDN
jgi:hypothetical protein